MVAKATARFSLGKVVATPGALEALSKAGQSPDEFLARHRLGEWGDVCAEDKQLNDQALLDGGRLLSAYHTSAGEKLWIITEADRTSTASSDLTSIDLTRMSSATHTAIIVSSGRHVPVIRLDRMLIVLHGRAHGTSSPAVSTCLYDHRFKLLPQRTRK